MTDRVAPYTEGANLKAVIIVNPLDEANRRVVNIKYDPALTFSDLIRDLPSEAEWVIGYNGRIWTPDEIANEQPVAGSNFSVVRVPEGGGDDGKQILRLVAVIALTVVSGGVSAGLIGGLSGFTALAAGAAISVAGTLLINAVLPPPTPDNLNAGTSIDQSQSYGIDGPKPSAQEGVPLGVVYGKYRTGGNIVDAYTKNFGSNQFLYLRTVVNDGEVQSISDIEINDQPIENFQDYELRVGMGTDSESENDWFENSVRPYNRSAKLDTTFITHTTTGDVDRVRFDFVAPQGIVEFDDEGNEQSRSVDVEIDYRDAGSSDPWAACPSLVRRSTVSETTAEAGGVALSIEPTGLPGASYSVVVNYRAAGSSDPWVQFVTKSGQIPTSSFSHGGGVRDLPNRVFEDEVAPIEITRSFSTPGAYEFQVTGGTIEQIEELVSGGDGVFTIQGQENTKALRYSIESAPLARGEYEFRVRRTSFEASGSDNKTIDSLYLADVNEIDIENVRYNGRATISVRIRISEQLRGIPKITGLVEGSIVNEYDEDGVVTSTGYTANAAWVATDILTNLERGGGLGTGRILWDTVADWAAYCETDGLSYNGVFDFKSNVWDALQQVARRGHAQLVQYGTKYGFVIDRAAEPKMLFGSGNIIKGTFTTNWLPLADRANEVRATYQDEDDGYRGKVVRLVDDVSLANGAPERIAEISLPGVTKLSDAAVEAELILRRNKLIFKTISFDAPVEAIALAIGDVAYVEHPSTEYANGESGRLANGSTVDTLKLDRPVTMEAGESYKALVHYPALLRGSVTVLSKNGNTLSVSSVTQSMVTSNRVKLGDLDVRVTDLDDGANTIQVEDASGFSVSDVIEVWQTDALEERVVTLDVGSTDTIALDESLPAAPPLYTNWLFGRVALVKKPFRLMGVGYSDPTTRSLSFIEHDNAVYDLEMPLPEPTVAPTVSVAQVQDVTATTRLMTGVDRGVDRVTITWTPPNDINYSGADVYISESNGFAFRHIGTVLGSNEIDREFRSGEKVTVKVVAIGDNSRRASFNDAPVTSFTVTPSLYTSVTAPTNLQVVRTDYSATASTLISWDAVADQVLNYRVDVREIDEVTYDDVIAETVTPTGEETGYERGQTTSDTQIAVGELAVGFYQVRVRAERGETFSDWSVLTLQIVAPDLSAAVTGLRVDGGLADASSGTFSGNNAEFFWTDVAFEEATSTRKGQPNYWRDYEVRILSDADELLRTDYTRDPKYTYAYEKNVEDSAGRSFKIEVRIRGRHGQLSTAASMSVSNPAPAAVTASVETTPYEAALSYTLPTDSDFRGVKVWIGDETGFAEDVSNLVWDGPGQPRVQITPNSSYFLKIGAYDAFDSTPENIVELSTSSSSVEDTTLRRRTEWLTAATYNAIQDPLFRLGVSKWTKDFGGILPYIDVDESDSDNRRMRVDFNASGGTASLTYDRKMPAFETDSVEYSAVFGFVNPGNITCTLELDWFNQADNLISTSVIGVVTGSGDQEGGFADAPANSYRCQARIKMVATGTSSALISRPFWRIAEPEQNVLSEFDEGDAQRISEILSVKQAQADLASTSLFIQVADVDRYAQIVEEASARITADTAFTETISGIQSSVDNVSASVTQNAQAIADNAEATASFSTIVAATGSTNAIVTLSAGLDGSRVSVASDQLVFKNYDDTGSELVAMAIESGDVKIKQNIILDGASGALTQSFGASGEIRLGSLGLTKYGLLIKDENGVERVRADQDGVSVNGAILVSETVPASSAIVGDFGVDAVAYESSLDWYPSGTPSLSPWTKAGNFDTHTLTTELITCEVGDRIKAELSYDNVAVFNAYEAFTFADEISLIVVYDDTTEANYFPANLVKERIANAATNSGIPAGTGGASEITNNYIHKKVFDIDSSSPFVESGKTMVGVKVRADIYARDFGSANAAIHGGTQNQTYVQDNSALEDVLLNGVRVRQGPIDNI